MLDITWKVFSETGNIETYLLLKELENVDDEFKQDLIVNQVNPLNEDETFQKL